MKEDKENIEEQFQEFLDQKKPGDTVKNLVEDNSGLKYLKETDSLLKSMAVQNPGESFTQNVMKRLEEEPSTARVRKQGLIILFGVIMVLMITAFYVNAINPNAITVPEGVNVVGQEISLEGLGSMMDFGLIIKGLMFVTFFLAMLIFDRAVLRPLFDKRRNFG